MEPEKQPSSGAVTKDDNSTAAKTANADKADDTGKPTTTADRDPMRELLDRLDRFKVLVTATDPALAKTIQDLGDQGKDAEQRSQPRFRTDVAFALHDLERFHTGRLDLPTSQIRSEMTRLAGSMPGLENERMQALMRATTSINDRPLIREIREVGKDIALRTDQAGPAIESRIDVLENKVRLTDRAPDPAQATPNSKPETPSPPRNADQSTTSVRQATPGSEAGTDRAANGTPQGGMPQGNTRSQDAPPSQGPATVNHSVLDTLLRAFRPDSNQPTPPWEPPPTPMADRIASEERKVLVRKDNEAFGKAETRGAAALDALQGFANGEGAAVMSKIREAAKTEPGGLPRVLSEMREGGRFADLRKQFGNALADDAGVAAAYDKAASSLAAYGKTRADVENIIGRRPDAEAVTQRFEKLDADIGNAAASTPSKNEGRSMMDDLAKQAAELLQRAVDAVKGAFSRSPSASATAGASPSPSMSP